MVLSRRMSENDGLGRMWEEAVIVYLGTSPVFPVGD